MSWWGAWAPPRSRWAVDVAVPPLLPPPHLTVLCLGVHVQVATGRGGPGGPVPDPTPLSPNPPVDILGGSRAPPPLTLLVLSGEAMGGAGRAGGVNAESVPQTGLAPV